MRFLWPCRFLSAWQGQKYKENGLSKEKRNKFLFLREANPYLLQICPDLFPRKKGSQSKANPYLLQICPDLFPRKKKANPKQILICFRFVQICFREKRKPIQSKSLFASDLFRFVSKKGKPIQSKSLFVSDLSRFVSEKKESQSKQILGKPKFVPDNGLSFPITRQKNKARRPNGRQAFSLKVVKVISPLTCGSTFPCLPR